jgi:Na+-driven multidrug efflux pump
MLPFLGINILGTGFFQSIAKGHIAIMLGAMRQFIFLLPLVIILPQFFGLTGVWMATPIADAISILATAIALLYHFKETPSLAQEA